MTGWTLPPCGHLECADPRVTDCTPPGSECVCTPFECLDAGSPGCDFGTDPARLPDRPHPGDPVTIGVDIASDDRMPGNAAVIVGKGARLFMAPVGTGPDEPGWHDVGWAHPTGLAIDSWANPAADVALRSLDTLRAHTLSLTIPHPTRPDPKSVPTTAPLDLWDVIYGPTHPKSRAPARQAALASLASACHTAYGNVVVGRAEWNAATARAYAALERLIGHNPVVLHPRDWADLVEHERRELALLRGDA